MGSYSVLIKPSAAKEIEDAGQKKDRSRLVRRIRLLAGDPRPRGCEKLAGRHELYRIRVGDYRFVYEVDDEHRLVHVVKIGHRRDVYR